MQNINTINLEQERKIADLQKRVDTLENLCYSTKEVLTLEEASLYMGISRSMLYKMTHNGDIPFYKPTGKLIFFEKSHLLEWLRRNRVRSNAETRAEADLKLRELSGAPSGSNATNVPSY